MLPVPELFDLPLQAPGGARTTLRREAQAQPLVAVFLRHFGCLFCRERVAQFAAEAGAFAAAGARVVFVGTGTGAMAADFQQSHGHGLPVFGDPERRTYRQAGMRRSFWESLHPRLFVNALRAFRRGFRQTKVQGDPWQQGGVLVFAADGALAHAAIDQVAGDPLDVRAVLAAVRALPGRGAVVVG
jgi:peroxiredoxin